MTRVKRSQLPLLWNCLVLKKVIRLIYLNSDVKILKMLVFRGIILQFYTAGYNFAISETDLTVKLFSI